MPRRGRFVAPYEGRSFLFCNMNE